MNRSLLAFAGIFTIILVGTTSFSAQEIDPAAMVERHLNAIGTKEKRAAMKNMMAIGDSLFESRNPNAQGGGRAVVVTDRSNLFFALSFNSRDYPFEKIGYFGSSPSIPFAIAGKRSLLGSFLTEHSPVLDHGLFAGIFSMRWPLHDVEARKAKLKLAGTSKVNGVEAYSLDYSAAKFGASEFRVKLFFDAKTFAHIRTEYKREIPAGRIVFGQQNQVAGSTLQLTEDFSDFRLVDGLSLPHSYRVHFVSNSGSTMVENIWGIRVAEFRFDQNLAPDFFTFETKS